MCRPRFDQKLKFSTSGSIFVTHHSESYTDRTNQLKRSQIKRICTAGRAAPLNFELAHFHFPSKNSNCSAPNQDENEKAPKREGAPRSLCTRRTRCSYTVGRPNGSQSARSSRPARVRSASSERGYFVRETISGKRERISLRMEIS